MKVRRTIRQELDEVMHIYGNASAFMRESGNPNQWRDGYPPRALVEADVEHGASYVILEGGRIEGVFSFLTGEDATYRKIWDGAFRTDGPYGTIHRLASAGTRRGVADACFAWCGEEANRQHCVSLRADTHRDNRKMQRLLEAHGFVYCGVIYVADKTPRLAYERLQADARKLLGL